MRRNSAVVGAILMVIGVALGIVAVFPFTGTNTFIDESHTIDGYSFFAVPRFFSARRQVHITITVSSGAVDFWVMNETEYDHFENETDFYYYISPSRRSVSSAKIDWVPPYNNEIIYFVWNNPDSTSKVVSIVISYDYPLLPDWIRFVIGGFGGILFFIGLPRVLRRTQKPAAPPSIT